MLYFFIFYNITISQLFPLDSFRFIFLLRDSENDLYFNIERGVRQGDHLSTAGEILAIAIRSQEDIEGIRLNNLETKLLQFADYTTVVLSDLDSARALFVFST